MSPPTGGERAAKKKARKSAKRGKKSPAKRASKTTAKRAAKKGARKQPRRAVKKPAGKQPRTAAKQSARKRVKKRGKTDRTGAPAGAAVRNAIEESVGFVRKKFEQGAGRARDVATTGLPGGTRERVREAGRNARAVLIEKTHDVQHVADDAVATARAVGVGAMMRVGDARHQVADRLALKIEDLEDRILDAKDRGVDFFQRHREEILALLFTAVKIAAVIGVRRLTAGRARGDDGKAARRIGGAVAVVSAAIAQLAQLVARQPSVLPLLREVYRKGSPAEQAVVGLLLDPTLRSDPEHALDVIQGFLQDASDEPAADTIAKRTLAPLLAERPELVDQVKPWIRAATPFVRRAALIALSRVMTDRRSRAGDLVAAAVVVLEDHDEQVRQAMKWFLQEAAEVDIEATAKQIARWADKRGDGADNLLDILPRALARRVKAIRDEDR